MLYGTLEDFSSGGILRVLSSDGRSGAIRFGGAAGCAVYLHHGELYFAGNETTDAALTTALVRPGRVTADAWSSAVKQADGRPIVGELLVRRGAIRPDLLASVVRSVMYDPLIALFLTGRGDFYFEPDVAHWLGPFRVFPVEAVLAEVRQRAREADEWRALMPTMDVVVAARATLPDAETDVTLSRVEWELVTALMGQRSIRDLAVELGSGTYETARIVHALSEAGLLDVCPNTADPGASRHLRPLPTLLGDEPDAPVVDPVSIGLPPLADGDHPVVHHRPVEATDPTDRVRPRRKGGRRAAGRGGAHRSRG